MSLAIVKLGGSSAASATLPDWLAAIEAATRPLVLVPGGGPFADRVRETQQALGFSNRAAHAMALLAMEQFAHVLLDRSARLQPARSIDDISAVIAGDMIPVWFPAPMVLHTPDIPASWDMTSDSLAAWLAARLDASELLLIKQTDDFSAGDTCATLMARGIVDAAFGGFLPPLGHSASPASPSSPQRGGREMVCAANRSGEKKAGDSVREFTLHLAGPRHLAGAAAAFASRRLPGERIAPTGEMRKAG